MKNRKDVCNQDIRAILEGRNIRHYEVARECGINKYTFSSWLALPLDEARRERILDAIDRIIKRRG